VFCNAAQLLRQVAPLGLQGVQQAQLAAGAHEGGVQGLEEGRRVHGHRLQHPTRTHAGSHLSQLAHI
jgi:hypothetical protein